VVDVISNRFGCAPMAWLAAAVLAASGAHAQPAAVSISYLADATCPAPAVFLAWVREKTPNVGLAPPGMPVRYAVSASGGPAQSFARLAMLGPDFATTTRDLTGASCEEVVRAIALTTSLAITRDTEQRPQTPEAPPPAPPPPPPAPPAPPFGPGRPPLHPRCAAPPRATAPAPCDAPTRNGAAA
jgi:hypothetical protein